MKVLHVLDHSLPVTSGYSYRSRSIMVFQKRLGVEPVVLTSPKHGSERDDHEVREGILHYRTGRTRGHLPFIRELCLMTRLTQRIMRVARQEQVSVIHAHSPLLNGLPSLWAGRKLGIRVVYEVRTFWEDAAVNHGTFREGSTRYRISRALETFLLKRADSVVAICSGIRAEVLSRGIAPERVAVVPNGVDPEWLEFRPRAERLASRFGLGGGPVFGYVGSFSHYEGLPFLVELAPEFLRRLPGSRLLIVGGGRDESQLRESVRRAGPSVVLTGRIPQDEVRDLYSVIDVLVLPRRRIRLTEMVTPLKPLEAMAAGTAVLASDIGGHTELIDDRETGVLFKTESGDSLVEQAIRLGGQPELRARIADNARRFIREERTWDRIVPRYLPLYRGGV